MNPKNLLQEYIQARCLPLPIYETVRIGGLDHQPSWQSSVLFEGKITTGEANISKSKAEMSAASKALALISPTSPISPISSNPNTISRLAPPRTVLLVDVENMPNFVEEVVKEIMGLYIYAFVGEHHCLAGKIFPQGVKKVLSPSTRPDGTDTCMQVYVGYFLARDEYDTYLIATRDHYGSALVDMITAPNLLWIERPSRVVTKVSHILL